MLYPGRITLGSLQLSPTTSGAIAYVHARYRVRWFADWIDVPKGFDSDYASVPRFLWAIIPPHYYPHASVLHDWTYTVRLYDRATCDLLYYHALQACGASPAYALACYAGVRLFGWMAWRSDAQTINLYRSLGNLPPI